MDQIQALATESLKHFSLKARKEEELVRALREQMENELEFEAREHEERIEQII